MKDSIRQKLGVDEEDFVVMFFMGSIIFMALTLSFTSFINEYPVLSVVTLLFILVLSSSVHLIRKYLEVRKLEAQPSAEELLKKQYVENENLDIQNFGDEYKKLKEIEEET